MRRVLFPLFRSSLFSLSSARVTSYSDLKNPEYDEYKIDIDDITSEVDSLTEEVTTFLNEDILDDSDMENGLVEEFEDFIEHTDISSVFEEPIDEIDHHELKNLIANMNDTVQRLGTSERPFHINFEFPNIWGIIFQLIIVYAAYRYFFRRQNEQKKGSSQAEDIKRAYIGDKPKPLSNIKTRFSDVKGIDETKAELEEIVEFLKNPGKFTRLGGRIPKGILLHGKPGTGKTLLAKALAGEGGCPFFYASGSQFEEVFVGVGAKRIRELFSEARKQSPCIVFIDEIDSLASSRAKFDPSYLRMTLNQLLAEMDGFKDSEGVVIVAATNFFESLDRAILRPGRFDKIVHVPLPDLQGRVDILKLFLKNVPSSKIDHEKIARTCCGMSGADIENVVNLAAIEASKAKLDMVRQEEMEVAIDRHLIGVERKSRMGLKDQIYHVSIHEVGHAYISYLLESIDKIHKITVIPRGSARGYTAMTPGREDFLSYTKNDLLKQIKIFLAGRACEEVFFGQEGVCGGAKNDFRRATDIAYLMVYQLGFSTRLGPMGYHNPNSGANSRILSNSGGGGGGYSEETKRVLDEEVRKIINEAYTEVKKMIQGDKQLVEKVARKLIEMETMTGVEFIETIEKEKSKQGYFF